MMLQVLMGLAIIWGMVLLLFTLFAGAFLLGEWRLKIADRKRASTEAQIRPEGTTKEALGDLFSIAKNQDHYLTAAWAQEKADEDWTEEEMQEFLDNRPPIELN